nr:sugar ABC transporter ATP-binding protein [Streptomyces sp. MSC1_001]
MSTSADAEPRPAPLLRLSGITKSFPGVRALDGVELTVRAGEVHCLLGQNGAGKSTLIKVLSGIHRPDAGSIHWQGQPTHFAGPQDAMNTGIATMYQELDLVPDMSVAENIFLGHEPSTAGLVHRRTVRAEAAKVLARLGHGEIPVDRAVGRLPAATQQIVSMARALSRQAKLLIMDEPSAVLSHEEVANLFRTVRDLTAQGVAVIYISHRLDEIREICDRVTVLKDGHTAAAGLPANAPTAELVSRMTGRSIEYVFPARGPAPAPDTKVLLQVERLTRHREFQDISLTVKPGEIVGIAGLVGSGRSELLETIAGARRPDSGRITVEGRTLPAGDVPTAVRAGIGLAPEERKSQALLLGESVQSNIGLASLARHARGGFLRRTAEHTAAASVADKLELRPRNVSRKVGTLSGGNQQKAVVGRWLLGGTRLLLLDEPTRGVDIGARAELYQVIRDLADSGVGVLMVSSEVPEVLGLADRVLVMREGRIVHQADSLSLDEHAVLDLVMAGPLLEGTTP